MRLCTFRRGSDWPVGAVVGDGVVDLGLGYAAVLAGRGRPRPAEAAAAALPAEMIAFLAMGEPALAAAAEVVAAVAERGPDLRGPGGARVVIPAGEVRLGAPVPRPRRFIAIGSNYYDLLRQFGWDPPKEPKVFARFSDTVIGPGEPIVLPRTSAEVEYEGELAFVVGKGGRHIPEERAFEHIVGYTVCNDVTCHDWYVADGGLGRAKNADTSGPLGPHLVTRDEVPDPQNLSLRLSMGGRLLQNSNTSRMVFSVPVLLSFLSRCFALQPGDVVATGAPAGLSWSHDPPAYLYPGAEVTIEVERVGTLRNPVVAEA